MEAWSGERVVAIQMLCLNLWFSGRRERGAAEPKAVLTFPVSSDIVNTVIVPWKLAKFTDGGEPAGISLFYIIGDFGYDNIKIFYCVMPVCPDREHSEKSRNERRYRT